MLLTDLQPNLPLLEENRRGNAHAWAEGVTPTSLGPNPNPNPNPIPNPNPNRKPMPNPNPDPIPDTHPNPDPNQKLEALRGALPVYEEAAAATRLTQPYP